MERGSTAKNNKEKQMADENKTKKMKCWTNCVRVQQSLIIELQILKWNLCEENVQMKCCSTWSAYCKIGDKHEMWAKEKVTGAVYGPGMWKKLYSEQYKRYNLIRGDHCGRTVRETAPRTALAYYCIHSGLYAETVLSVQRCWSMLYCCRAGSSHEPGA